MTKLWDEEFDNYGIETYRKKCFITPEPSINPPTEHSKHWGMMLCKPIIKITGIDKHSFKEKTITVYFEDYIPVDLEGVEVNSQEESDLIITESLAVLENLLPRRYRVALEDVEVEG